MLPNESLYINTSFRPRQLIEGVGGVVVGGGGAGRSAPQTMQSREQSQLAKLRDANAKYKNLLKLAKERIQETEGVLDERRTEVKQLTAQLNEAIAQNEALLRGVAGAAAADASSASGVAGASPINLNNETTILRVCQRVKEEIIMDDSDKLDNTDQFGNVMETSSNNKSGEETQEIWALIEYETSLNNDGNSIDLSPSSYQRHKQWSCFKDESALSDYIRRDTGEPLTLPSYSFTPDQSQRVADDAKKTLQTISEEFRRFRVRAEVAKKQADATVRALQTNTVQTTRMLIEGQDIESELAQAKTDHAQLSTLRSEMAEQEARWKESYDLLLAENDKLKSSGAEALLAAQWRHRYETCLKEKEDIMTNLTMEKGKVMEMQEQRQRVDAGKYEQKYRELKESFRMYRTKAQELFQSQQLDNGGGGGGGSFISSTLNNSGSEVARLSYLKNLMVNYLASDMAVREHMEVAIGTVLNFTEEEKEKIKRQKVHNNGFTLF